MRILTLVLLLFAFNVSAETRLEVGPTFLSDDYAEGQMAVLTERVGKWDFSYIYVTEQDAWPGWEKRHGYGPAHLERNSAIHIQRIWKWKKAEFGFGVARWANTSRALGHKTTYPLMIGWNFNKHLSLRIRHYSNAGSATPNLGQDAITIGWTF